MSLISTDLKGGVTSMSAVQAEARIRLQAPSAVSATSLRVAGATCTGRNEKEARDTCSWDIQRRELRQAWISMKQARDSKLYVQSQLGSDATADKETKTERRATVKDQDNLADSMLSGIYSFLIQWRW